MAPRMKNPPHPGGLIKDNIEEFGHSVAEAARGLGVTRQQLYRVIRGESGISPGNGRASGKSVRRSRRLLAKDADEFRLGAGSGARREIKAKPLEPKVA